MLHDNLRELGYNKILEKAAAAIPDARDRLAYVSVMTEQAAERSLNATEIAKPIQDKLAADAAGLSACWQQLFDNQSSAPLDSDAFKSVVAQTRSYLDDVPKRADATNVQLLEIMMAQDFQDLTGQVIKKITEIVQNLEQQLVQLLLDNVPGGQKRRSRSGIIEWTGDQSRESQRRRDRPEPGGRFAREPWLLSFLNLESGTAKARRCKDSALQRTGAPPSGEPPV